MLNFQENYILENERVRLAPLQKSDVNNLLSFAENEPELWQFSLIQAIGKEGLENYINVAIEARNQLKEYAFVVFDKYNNQYAGSTRFYDIQLNNRCLQFGFTWYGKNFQGTGLNKHCKYLMLDFAFDKLKMERVEFRADFANKRSIAAMKSVGCVEEGILRSNGFRPDGTRRDSIVLSILKPEWEQSLKSQLYDKLVF